MLQKLGAECLHLEGPLPADTLFTESYLQRADAVLAVTDDDKTNLLASVRAKTAGAGLSIALVNDPTMVPLMGPLGIDAYVNPRATTVSSILRHIRQGRVRGVYSIGDAEAEYVVGSILANRELGMQLRDQAVLFRGSHHSDRLELERVRRNIPYVKYGGLKFLEAAHVKDLLSVLKWAENPKNEVAAFRVLKLLPGLGPAYAARCFESLACQDFSFATLSEFRPPASSAGEWGGFCAVGHSSYNAWRKEAKP